MTDGYSHKPEVEGVLKAVMELGGPGQVLWGRAQVARDEFRKLDYAGMGKAADELAGQLEAALAVWTEWLKALR